jgi:hypothetical protein
MQGQLQSYTGLGGRETAGCNHAMPSISLSGIFVLTTPATTLLLRTTAMPCRTALRRPAHKPNKTTQPKHATLSKK